MMAREKAILDARLALTSGDVLSVGCGLHPGRHLFPAPAFRLTAVDIDPGRVATVQRAGTADEAFAGAAGSLPITSRFDVILYRLVLHHIAYHGSISHCFAEAAQLLRPGGVMVAIEPGLWHPIGALLQLANRLGWATFLHGTPDDLPLSPHQLISEARAVGLRPELQAVTYTWRRLPPRIQQVLQPLDGLGSRPRPALFGHTLMLIARKEGE